jgi:hypothetical protein
MYLFATIGGLPVGCCSMRRKEKWILDFNGRWESLQELSSMTFSTTVCEDFDPVRDAEVGDIGSASPLPETWEVQAVFSLKRWKTKCLIECQRDKRGRKRGCCEVRHILFLKSTKRFGNNKTIDKNENQFKFSSKIDKICADCEDKILK